MIAERYIEKAVAIPTLNTNNGIKIVSSYKRYIWLCIDWFLNIELNGITKKCG